LILLAAGEGFSFADPYAIALTFLGLAGVAAIAALSHQAERAFSASVIYLALGLAAALAIDGLNVGWLQPDDDATVIQRLSEAAVIIALFGAGLKVEREVRPTAWGPVWRLLGIGMPLTIGALVLFGTGVMGLSLAAAIAVGAALAPTDPVLAGDIGIGPPGEEEEPEPNFALTAEAGLNDGLAYPFVFLAIFVGTVGEADEFVGEWLLADVLYAIVGGVALGALVGWGVARLTVPLRDGGYLDRRFDGWLAIVALLLIYGITEIVGAYGFIAAFVGGLAFRRYEYGHEINREVHDAAENVEKLGELALILLLGTLVSIDDLRAPGVGGWLLAPLLLLVIRPLCGLVALAGSRAIPGWRERLFVAFFGVRGIGSLYYVAVILGSGALSAAEGREVFWTVAVTVMASIFLHGIASAPLERRLLRTTGRE
jgi:NhaP-type Na+/H+ or K+/H+ antiporter